MRRAILASLCVWALAVPAFADPPEDRGVAVAGVLPPGVTQTQIVIGPYINSGGIPVASITFKTGTGIRTGTTAGDTVPLQAYDTDTGPAYVTLATVTAGPTPSISVTGLASGTVAAPSLAFALEPTTGMSHALRDDPRAPAGSRQSARRSGEAVMDLAAIPLLVTLALGPIPQEPTTVVQADTGGVR